MKYRTSIKSFAIYCILIVGAIIFLAPFFFVIINSVKSDSEYLVSKLSIPKTICWNNYVASMAMMQYGKALFNSLVITILSLCGILVVASMAAYKIARTAGKFNTFVFFLFLSVFVVPFQSVMIPIVVMVRNLHLMDSLLGMILAYIGLVAPTAIFLYRGFVQTIPISLEECAQIDGATPFQVFSRIVLPLLIPITSTIIPRCPKL
ncbi:MAG: carbohydrate ABC transporter permease [Spirochaetia bacterium]|jgi:raffinose/stachyose/melibiose transport system permease protein|nr:carbohydrate ABC transporter permease [Spirochaetia bacterium]